MRLQNALVLTFMFVSAFPAKNIVGSSLPDSLYRRNNTGCDKDHLSTSMSGAVLHGIHSGAYNFVTGTIHVPSVSGVNGSALIIAVGFDGRKVKCSGGSGMLYSGIYIETLANGKASYRAFYMDAKQNTTYFISDFSIYHEDQIMVSVVALNSTRVAFLFENLSIDKNVTTFMDTPVPFCRKDVWWRVARAPGEDNTSYLGPFTPVKFTNAKANTPWGIHRTPEEAQPICLTEDGVSSLTSVTINGSSMTVTELL